MKKLGKGILALVLSFVLISLVSLPVSAKDTGNEATVPEEVAGLDQFIDREEDGTLHLDSDMALEAGYTENITNAISNHLELVNQMVLAGEAKTDNDLNIYVISGGLIRAGVRKIVTYWWGQTDVYLASSDALIMIDTLNAAGNSLARLAEIVNNGTYDNVQNYALGILVSTGLLAFAYGYQIRTVSGNGTLGFIQQSVMNYDTGIPVISYRPQ